MKTRSGILVSLLAVVVFAAGAVAFQQDKKAAPASSMDDTPAFVVPGPAHKVLDCKIGKWTATGKFYMPGVAEPMMNQFTSEAKWILEGRFVEETVKGEWMGKAFHGTGITGYDNIKKKYVAIWIDNASTGIFHSEGTYDAATKTFHMTGESPDATMTKYLKSRSTDKMIDADHGLAQAYTIGPDGKEMLTFELSYTRAK